jgi:transposase
MLLRTLMAWLRDEPRVCSMVPIPDEADEEARRPHREREDLVRKRRSILSKIDAILATLGVKGYRGLRSDRREQLALLRQPDCDPVPLAAWVRIERLLARLELILRQIKEGEAARDAVLKKPAPADEAERMIRSLVDMRASGPELTTLLVARLSHGRSPIVGRSDPMLDSSGRHFPAAEASANKGSPRTGTDVCELGTL